MADYPKAFYDIARAAEAASPTDTDEATKIATQQIRELPEFPTFVDQLIEGKIRDFVLAARHSVNTRITARAGGYGGPRKVNSTSSAVVAAYDSVYNYRINGQILGSLTGRQLLPLRDKVDSSIRGFMFQRNLLERLAGMHIGPEQRVDAVVSEKKLDKVFKQLQQQQQHGAA